MTKAKLREIFKNKRLDLKLNLKDDFSEKINNNLINFIEENQINIIHCYLTQKKLHEVYTQKIIHHIWENNKTLITSVSNTINYTLEHYYLQADTIIQLNKWGIPEPIEAEKANIKNIEVVITPLLCFDKRGYRVGYGKGFYDKFFAECSTDIIKIGVSYFEPIEEIEDINEYDFPLDFVFTPDNFYAF
jgi:5-formyltetrahydrofolate cyclo-ligase